MFFLQKLLRFLDAEMPQPQPYGIFHLVCFALSILAGVLLCITHKRGNPDWVRKTVLITSVIVALLEVYKQINFSFSYEGGISFDYQWYAFPFQFCSTPMYIGLLAGFTKKGRLHNAANAYLATFSMFAGICVMFYPTTVFIDTIGINIQTMVCHGSMITLGIYLLYSGYVKREHKTILRAIPVFITCVLLAMLLNEIAYRTGLLENDTFDMFYISPYCTPSLPLFSLIQPHVPFLVSVLIYVSAFSLASYLILLAAMGIARVAEKKAKVTV